VPNVVDIESTRDGGRGVTTRERYRVEDARGLAEAPRLHTRFSRLVYLGKRKSLMKMAMHISTFGAARRAEANWSLLY
jgi:hypothetical protein